MNMSMNRAQMSGLHTAISSLEQLESFSLKQLQSRTNEGTVECQAEHTSCIQI